LAQECTKVTRSVDNHLSPPPALFLTTTEPEVTNNALAGIIAKLGDVSNATTAVGALAALQQGIDAKVAGAYAPGTLFFGLEGIRTGVTNPACSPTNPTNPANPCGIKEVVGIVSAGIDQLVAGISSSLSAPLTAANTGAGDLADGIAQAGDGAVQLADGASQLSGGIDQLAGQAPTAVSGAQQLAAGSSDLSKGSKKLAKGLNGKLAPGAEQLSAGLGDLNDAVTGSGQIADGLGQAHDGQSQIVDGAGQLSEQGTSQLVKSGNDTASSYGREYAIMKALDHKGATQGMPYGSPKGSSDNRGAYDITIAAVGSQHTMGNTGRGVVGLVVLGLGALGATLIRGRFA
jgi:putative membrane protein